MEQGEEKKPLTFNGIEVLSRRQNAGKLSEVILGYESKEELAQSLVEQGFKQEEVEKLHQAMVPLRGQKGPEIEKRKTAIDKLDEAWMSLAELPENKREWGDTFQGQSGMGSFATRGKYIKGIERKDKGGT